MLTQFRVKYLQQVGEFRQLSFIPADSHHWSLPRTKTKSRKSVESGVTRREHAEVSAFSELLLFLLIVFVYCIVFVLVCVVFMYFLITASLSIFFLVIVVICV